MNKWFAKYYPVIPVIILFFSCNNHPKASADANPIFSSNPSLKVVTQQINESPKNASLYYERGELLRKMQQDTLALRDFKIATVLDTTKAEYFSAVGDILFENKDLTGSVQWFAKAVEKNPNDKKAHLKIAKVFLYIKQYAKSFDEINKVLRQDVSNPEAYFLKGMNYKYMGDTAHAISSFQTSIQMAPDYRDAIIQLGLLYSTKRDPIALRYFDNALKIDSTDVFPLFAKGVFYHDNKDDDAAKEAYRECIIHDRHYVDAYFNMGYILMQEDSVEKAYRQYNIVTQIDPTNPAAYFNRGLCAEIMDSVKKAVEDYRLALSLDPNYNSPKEALKRLKVK